MTSDFTFTLVPVDTVLVGSLDPPSYRFTLTSDTEVGFALDDAPAGYAFTLAPVDALALVVADADASFQFALVGAQEVTLDLDADLDAGVQFSLAPYLRGEPGPPGVEGPVGPVGYYLEFIFASAVQVLIDHNFGRRPAVQVLSPGSLAVWAGVAHPSVNQVRLDFTSPQAGLAILTA